MPETHRLVKGKDLFDQVPGSAIADASTAHALNATFSDTEVEAALNALGTKINSILTLLRNTKLINA